MDGRQAVERALAEALRRVQVAACAHTQRRVKAMAARGDSEHSKDT